MGETTDRRFDWVAVAALASGAAVLVPSLAAFIVTLITIIAVFF